jgi:Transposase family tnp2
LSLENDSDTDVSFSDDTSENERSNEDIDDDERMNLYEHDRSNEEIDNDERINLDEREKSCEDIDDDKRMNSDEHERSSEESDDDERMSSDENIYFKEDSNHKSDRSRMDYLIIVLMFYLRHNLSLLALDDLLYLINQIAGSNILPKSTFLFKKLFPPTIRPNFHFYCPNCMLSLDEYDKLITVCPKCTSKISFETKTGKNFFITFNIETQIQDILKKNTDNIVFHKADSTNSNLTDVFDAILYKTHENVNNLITISYNTDGANVFKSSKCGSLWPIHFVVNELDPKVRYLPENIVVSGLWFGKDPPMELFFKPMVEELVQLNRKKSQIELNDNKHFDFQIRALICTADCPAKDKLMKKNQFNGYFGCNYCLHPGELVNNRYVRYTNLPNIEKRTHESVISDMKLAHETKITINGMKGLSPLAAFPKFDVIHGLSIDYMHCALLGVGKMLLEMWLDPSNHHEKYYIGLRKTEIDSRLLKIRPPTSLSRMPRSINDITVWKANEHRNYLLFYSLPCLYQILTFKYLNHYMKLSKSIYILLKSKITAAELNYVDILLKEFVIEFQQLYGKLKMVFNVHLISHLVESVRYCGPLWATSQFHFEDNNNVLIKYVKGTTDVLKQISSKYVLNKFIESNHDQSEIVQDYYDRTKHRKKVKRVKKYESLTLLNNYIPIEATNVDDGCLYYKRMIYTNTLFHTIDYCKQLKTNDSVVELIDGTLGEIKLIITIKDDCFVLLKIFSKSKNRNIFENFDSQICLIDNLEIADCLYPINSIKRKGILMNTGSTISVTFFPNDYERD